MPISEKFNGQRRVSLLRVSVPLETLNEERRSCSIPVFGPKLNPKTSAEEWFKKAEAAGAIAPQRKLANEKPKGETVDYDTLITSWPAAPPKRS